MLLLLAASAAGCEYDPVRVAGARVVRLDAERIELHVDFLGHPDPVAARRAVLEQARTLCVGEVPDRAITQQPPGRRGVTYVCICTREIPHA